MQDINCLTLAERIRLLRERRQITQARLAERAGLHPNMITRIECGRIANPGWSTMQRLASGLDCGMEAFQAGHALPALSPFE